MEQFSDFLTNISDYAGIFLLMLSTFLIGYFSAFSMEHSKYSRLLRKLKRKEKLSGLTQKEKDIEVIFTEIKPKILEVVKEAQEGLHQEPEEKVYAKAAVEVAENARTSYITYTHNAPDLNFDNFGLADKKSAEDLTKINGIGPYIEQKLNEIGIYNYNQISRLKEEDIRVLTELIDFFPGRIERDRWVEQAEDLLH